MFASKINPLKKASSLKRDELEKIIFHTKKILKEAIKQGGTTIKSYESSKGVHGRFQRQLLIHEKTICPICHEKIKKEKIGGRGTYYCPNCQR